MKNLIFAMALLAARANAMDYTAVFNTPPARVPTQAMPDGPLLGNGDVGVTLAGPPEAQVFYIGKNDFWTRAPSDAKVINVGRVELKIPALQGATYRQEQDLALAEVRGVFSKGTLTVRTRSWVDARENLLLTELQCDGTAAVPVSIHPVSTVLSSAREFTDNDRPVTIGRELHFGGRWYFDGEIADPAITNTVLSGKVPDPPRNIQRFNGKDTWREIAVPRLEKRGSVAAWIRIASTSGEANYIVSKGDWNQAYSLGLSGGRLRWCVNGAYLQTEQPLELGKWLYVAGTFDGMRKCLYVNGALQASDEAGPDYFSRKADDLPGHSRAVAVVTRTVGAGGLDFALTPGRPVVAATAIASDLDATDYLAAARERASGLRPEDIEPLLTQHRAWWKDFWSRSFIEIPDKEIEKHWYAALYIMGSCSRPGKVAPGLWGNWLTTDHPLWHGDFHLNYNFEAPFYIVYSSNHADLSLPYYEAIDESIPEGRAMAKRHGWKGIHFSNCTGPWGLHPENPDGDFGQRSDAVYAALPFIWYWQYTRDREWLESTGYPFLRGVADFWEDYLKFEDGRYVIHNDAINESSGGNVNPIFSLGAVHALFENLISMSAVLGVDSGKRAKWQDIVDKLSPFPTFERNGKTVFRMAAQGPAWVGNNTLQVQQVFPAGAIGLGSDPKLLEISRNTIDEMNRWHDINGFSSLYPACARVGYDPAVILAKLHAECVRCSMPNLLLYPNDNGVSGGGIENVSGFLCLNEMLLQSHEGAIRFFPDWPRDQDARFGGLRAMGAFLVSAEVKEGRIGGVKILSEKGTDCTVVNPWPGRKVALSIKGKSAGTLDGDRFTFKTKPGESVELSALQARGIRIPQ